MSGRHDSPAIFPHARAPAVLPMVGLAVLALTCLAAGFLAPLPALGALACLTVGIACLAGLMILVWRQRSRRNAASRRVAQVMALLEPDAAPHFLTDADGVILASNSAARRRFAATQADTLAETLRGLFANPASVLFRLQNRLEPGGGVLEDVTTRRGATRIAAQAIDEAVLSWRVEPMADRAAQGRSAESLPVAMVTLGRSGAVLFMNDAARLLAGGRVKSLEALFDKTPLRIGEVNALNGADGPLDVIVAEHQASAGRRELFLFPTGQRDTGQDMDFERLPVPLMKLTPGGQILSANRLAQRLFGEDLPEEAEIADVMQGLGRPIADWLRDTAQGRQVHASEFLRLNRKDKEVFVQVTLSRVVQEGETMLIAVLNDATELKSLEAQFVQSQKMQAIGQLAGGVAHDFNNLLTAISGHCDLLLLRHDQGDHDYGDLVQIQQNANRAAALVGQLLAFSRKQTLRPEIIDVRDTLSDLTHLLNRLVGEKVTLTLSHAPVLGAIRADKRQLEQVLMNLVVNARDAMPGGGEIRIDTEVVSLPEPLERDRATVPAGAYVLVSVHDCGSGISPDNVRKVFEPFFTTKRTGEGTGLGLSTAYGIVKQSGGFIFVDSTLGEGTSFNLYFPVHEPEAVQEEPAPIKIPVANGQPGDGVVLLVEDEAPVRAFASRALRLRGYTVLEAESAEDALAMLQDPELSVDVFVTDVVMPGMDGPSWVREALKMRPDVRVVFVSGYAEGAFGDDGPKIENSVFLPKPFSLNQLTDTVHEQMH